MSLKDTTLTSSNNSSRMDCLPRGSHIDIAAHLLGWCDSHLLVQRFVPFMMSEIYCPKEQLRNRQFESALKPLTQ